MLSGAKRLRTSHDGRGPIGHARLVWLSLADDLRRRTLRVVAAISATRASLHGALAGENLRRRTALSAAERACRDVRRAPVDEDQPVLDEPRESAALPSEESLSAGAAGSGHYPPCPAQPPSRVALRLPKARHPAFLSACEAGQEHRATTPTRWSYLAATRLPFAGSKKRHRDAVARSFFFFFGAQVTSAGLRLMRQRQVDG
jgi:hypothetical protein